MQLHFRVYFTSFLGYIFSLSKCVLSQFQVLILYVFFLFYATHLDCWTILLRILFETLTGAKKHQLLFSALVQFLLLSVNCFKVCSLFVFYFRQLALHNNFSTYQPSFQTQCWYFLDFKSSYSVWVLLSLCWAFLC